MRTGSLERRVGLLALLPLNELCGLPGEPAGRREEILAGILMLQFIHSAPPPLLETGRAVRRSGNATVFSVSSELVCL